MKKIIVILLLGLPLGLFAQSKDFKSQDKNLKDGWVRLTLGWKYKIGDNLEWAQPDYDDTNWKSRVEDLTNLNEVADSSIAGKNEIVWFRKTIKVADSLKESIFFNVVQTGASEIYLDGKLLHTFGVVSSNPATFELQSAPDDIFVFPLVPGKEQVLAVRYATGNQDFPLYNSPSFIAISLATITTLNSPDASLNNMFGLTRVGTYTFIMSLGATSLLSILFFTLFLFFPKERINGYFALSTFCMSVFLIIKTQSGSVESYSFWPTVFSLLSIYLGLLIMLFCIYRILNRRIGFWFWTLCALFFLLVMSIIVYPLTYLGLDLFVYFITIIVVSLRSLKTNRVAALIFISCIGLIFIYFISDYILYALHIDSAAYDAIFSGLSFMLLPLSIAMYLGYSFSQRSRSLEIKLMEVQKLSAENTRILSEQKDNLEKEVTMRTQDLNTSLENLKATQSQLIQSEKMASLGELTAGIAHEIQNPLNFVNNFSEVNKEMLEELKAERLRPIAERDDGVQDELINDVIANEEKINHHGKRADGIVKGMLQHSRSNSGKKEPTDLNKLADEYLRLAYHGLRAKDKSFNVTLDTNYDDSIGKIDIIPQDIGRVILNLVTNAFYACAERGRSTAPLPPEGGFKDQHSKYEPTVSISTKRISPLRAFLPERQGDKGGLTISVRDNGNGIPEEVLHKIFQPFFTTKPTGKGTGLGLSLSYDIIKAHGGELKVETTEGIGSVFTITLPRENIKETTDEKETI